MQEITIGPYTITRHDDKSVWIETEGGEGAQVPDDVLVAAIRAAYEV